MKIAIDCRMIHASGVGVYLQGCLPFLLASSNEFLLIGNRNDLSAYSRCDNTSILSYDKKPFSLHELLSFPRELKTKINAADCYYSPYFNIPGGITTPVYTTIHDLVFLDIPELVSPAGLAARRWFYRRAFRHSRIIFTVSEFSKSRIEYWMRFYYPNFEVPVVFTYSAVQPWILNSKIFYSERKNNIVFIGNIKKHKGLACLLEAFTHARLEGLSHHLVIIGSKDNFRTSDNDILQKIENLGIDAVSFTGFVSDKQLAEYIAAASLLVQPSLYEGFGLPPLEAMTLGTKALVSDIPVFREIYAGFPVTFFRSGDAADLKKKLTLLLNNMVPERISLTETQRTSYTFEKTAAKIMEALEKDDA
ncbi:MAG: glycosyltransferase family 4 protein [Treponema sp.]|jgi:glycosyltransferase involved in cell wall biosynthesis|nr:glycosyltransferase family 4 protein [Treponema sp.]